MQPNAAYFRGYLPVSCSSDIVIVTKLVFATLHFYNFLIKEENTTNIYIHFLY